MLHLKLSLKVTFHSNVSETREIMKYAVVNILNILNITCTFSLK